MMLGEAKAYPACFDKIMLRDDHLTVKPRLQGGPLLHLPRAPHTAIAGTAVQIWEPVHGHQSASITSTANGEYHLPGADRVDESLKGQDRESTGHAPAHEQSAQHDRVGAVPSWETNTIVQR